MPKRSAATRRSARIPEGTTGKRKRGRGRPRKDDSTNPGHLHNKNRNDGLRKTALHPKEFYFKIFYLPKRYKTESLDRMRLAAERVKTPLSIQGAIRRQNKGRRLMSYPTNTQQLEFPPGLVRHLQRSYDTKSSLPGLGYTEYPGTGEPEWVFVHCEACLEQ